MKKTLLLILAAVFSLSMSAETTTVDDVLNQTATGVTGSTYTDFTYTGTSGTAYAGQCAGSYESIQLRSSNNNSGIVVTSSVGTCKKIVVVWEENTVEGRTLDIYGKNTAYSAATDLYDTDAQGTLIGTIVNGTSTELEITDADYAYIGFHSASGAMYLTSVTITWETDGTVVDNGEGSTGGGDSTEVTYTGSGTAADPYTVADAISVISALESNAYTADSIYVKGIVSKVTDISTTYNDATYYISDDGSTTSDQLEIYYGYYFKGQDFTTGDEIAVTDTVIVYGIFQNYYGNTPEGAKNATYIYYLGKGPGVEEETVEIGGLETFENGGFEEWTDTDDPVGWVSTTSASNGTVSKSEVAHTGDYSAQLHHASSNKRLASKEFLLEAGTYTVSFYAKSVDADGLAEIAAGYAPWDSENNKMGSYEYDSYYTISADEWDNITWEFELEEETQLNLVIMNHSSGNGDVLIDDYTITAGSSSEGDESDETGIHAIDAASTLGTGAIYNLSGQKVTESYRGIVIVDGKKVLNK